MTVWNSTAVVFIVGQRQKYEDLVLIKTNVIVRSYLWQQGGAFQACRPIFACYEFEVACLQIMPQSPESGIASTPTFACIESKLPPELNRLCIHDGQLWLSFGWEGKNEPTDRPSYDRPARGRRQTDTDRETQRHRDRETERQ